MYSTLHHAKTSLSKVLIYHVLSCLTVLLTQPSLLELPDHLCMCVCTVKFLFFIVFYSYLLIELVPYL